MTYDFLVASWAKPSAPRKVIKVFGIIERIRQTALRFHRDAEAAARQELQTIISSLPDDQAIGIIRAFGYFSHLANIAEDQHHIRRTRAYAMANAAAREGTMAYALARAKDARLSRASLHTFFVAPYGELRRRYRPSRTVIRIPHWFNPAWFLAGRGGAKKPVSVYHP